MTRSLFAFNGLATALVLSWASGSLAQPAQQGGYFQPQLSRYQTPAQYSQPNRQALPAYGQPTRYTATPYTPPPQGPTGYAAYPNYPATDYRTAVRPQRFASNDAAAPETATQAESVPPPATTQLPAAQLPAAPVSNYPVADYPVAGYPQGNVGCADAPVASSWGGYVQPPAANVGCATGGCATGDCATGGYGTGDCDYGNFGGGADCGNGLSGQRSNRQWFFGVYGLYMSRDNPGYEKLAILVDSPASYPYYPTQAQTFLSTSNIDPDFQWGAEIRFGSTFGKAAGGYDACAEGCGSETACGPQPFAWEFVYWGLSENDQQAVRTDALADTDRIYGSVNFSGIEYDRDGAGATYAYRPLNDYFDYQVPITDPTLDPTALRVVAMRVRNTFKAQNLELNFLRFPLAGCQPCDPCGAPRFTLNGMCGVRYMKLDEDLQLASQFSNNPTVGTDPIDYTGGFPTTSDNNLFYDISTDNELVGFQLGSNMNWLIGSKWSAFCDTQFGIYGNKISNSHRVWSGTGAARFVGTGGAANVRSTKTDVSFLGEARFGFGHEVSCNCRWTTAYRVIAITGVALSGGQLKNDYANAEYVGIIDSNDSLVLHGLQTGLEWKY